LLWPKLAAKGPRLAPQGKQYARVVKGQFSQGGTKPVGIPYRIRSSIGLTSANDWKLRGLVSIKCGKTGERLACRFVVAALGVLVHLVDSVPAPCHTMSPPRQSAAIVEVVRGPSFYQPALGGCLSYAL
jgi:hypothetical protein